MARIPYATRDAFPPEFAAAYDRMLRERGDPTPNVFLALANIPNLLDALLTFTGEMRKGAAVPARLRELAIVAVGHVAGCSYEFDHHWNTALKAGVRRAQLESLADWTASPEFDPTERAVIHYATEVTVSRDAGDATWSALREHLGQREAMDIVMAVAWYNAVVRILLPLRIETEDWFRRA